MDKLKTFFIVGCFLFLPFIRFVIDYFHIYNSYRGRTIECYFDIYFAAALLPLVIMAVGLAFMLYAVDGVGKYVEGAWSVKNEKGQIAKETKWVEGVLSNMLLTCFIYGIVLLLPIAICLVSFIFGADFGILFKNGDHVVGTCFVVLLLAVMGVIHLITGIGYFEFEEERSKNSYYLF